MSRDSRRKRDLHAFNEEGMVLCNPRDKEAAQRFLAHFGGDATVHQGNIGSNEDCVRVVQEVCDQHGKLDILVNNAGITRDQLMMRMKRSDWDAVLNTNLTGPFLLIQAVIGSMIKQRWGRIVNITSIFVQTGQAGQANFRALS